MAIKEFLPIGKENAVSSRDICSILQISPRELSHRIEAERRAGAPICANTDPEHPGYYMAANKEELEEFCGKLFHRAGEIHKTRRALLDALPTLPEREGA